MAGKKSDRGGGHCFDGSAVGAQRVVGQLASIHGEDRCLVFCDQHKAPATCWLFCGCSDFLAMAEGLTRSIKGVFFYSNQRMTRVMTGVGGSNESFLSPY
jgi:hypothetical protein